MMTPPVDTLEADPDGSTADSADAAAAKPLAWSIMQGIAGAAVPCLLVSGALLALWPGSQDSRCAGSVAASVFAPFGLLTAWAWMIYVTVSQRMPAARPIGGAFIVLLIFLGVLWLWDGSTERAHDRPWSPLLLAAILAYTLAACYWLYAYAFSPKARRYLGLA